MRYLLTSILFLTLQITFSQAKYTKILKSIQEKESLYSGVAQQIWSYAEMGYQEQLSSALLQKH
jgi:aminobenzoyl-glutamate utilization protein B